MMRGKPVSGGTIQTYFLDNAALQGGFGRIKEDGTFVLETPVEAEIQEGLFVGNHKVVIYNYLPSAGAAAGPLTTPTQYSTPEQTPLKLKVTKETAGTPLEFMLEADEDTPTEAFVEEYMSRVEEARAAAEELAALELEASRAADELSSKVAAAKQKAEQAPLALRAAWRARACARALGVCSRL